MLNEEWVVLTFKKILDWREALDFMDGHGIPPSKWFAMGRVVCEICGNAADSKAE